MPEGYKSDQKKGWYEKRNAVAHGRAHPTMTLAEYIDVDFFVTKTMLHITRECREKLKLVV